MTIAAVGAIIGAVGTVVTGVMSYQASKANAAIMEMNAEISEDNARRAQLRSQREQEEQDFLSRALLGEQLSQQAASGASVERGSPVQTRMAARRLAALDALNVRQAGDLEAYNYLVDAASGRAQAQVTRMEGRNAILSSFINAGSVVTKSMANGSFSSSTTSGNPYIPVPTPRPSSLLA